MFTKSNLVGRKFGKLKVKKFLHTNNTQGRVWLCLCECGKKVNRSSRNLNNPFTKIISCGCKNLKRGGSNKKKLKGKFNNWTIISSVVKKKKFLWKCKCICGSIGYLNSHQLTKGLSKSCTNYKCQERYVSTEKIEEEYLNFIDKHGRSPTINEMDSRKEFTYGYGTIKKRMPIEKFIKKHKLQVKAGGRWYLDSNYFKKIDSPDKAYFLGLIITDGSINKNSVRVALQDRDRHILESFKRYLDTPRPLGFLKKRDNKHMDQYILSFSDKQIVKDLNRYGIKQNKTYTTKLPSKSFLSKKLFRHFFRGVFDGDGTIKNSGSISIASGSQNFVKQLKKIIYEYYKIESVLFKTHPTVFNIRINGALRKKNIIIYRGVTKILYNLFYDKTPKDIYFLRKFNSFKKNLTTNKNKQKGKKIL